jgi:thiol-disulfide isomerase/thioredoxin
MKEKLLLIVLAVLTVFHIYLFVNHSSKTFVFIGLGLVWLCFLGQFLNKDLFLKISNFINPWVLVMSAGMAFYGVSKMIARPKNQPEFDKPTAVFFESSDFKTALLKAKQEKKLIFIDFYTTWCGPCVAFKKTILADEEVAKTMNEKFINLAIDCEKGEGPTIAEKYNIRYFPTLLLIDAEGKIVKSLSENEVPTKNQFLESLK